MKSNSDIPNKPRMYQRPASQNMKYGGLSLAITVCFIAVIVTLNAIVSILGDRYSLKLDLTKDQIFKLSTESERFLLSLDKDVKLYVLTAEEYFFGGNLYYVQANEVLRQYASRTPRVTLEYIDLPKNPGFAANFPGHDISSYSIIVQSGEQSTVIMINDLFDIEYDEYAFTEYIVSSKAEQVLTAAILDVTSERWFHVVFLEGFGESGTEALEDILVLNRFGVSHQNIMMEEIEADADIAIICAPMRDYTLEELRKLDRFLLNDGLYGKSLLYFTSVLQQPVPNLNAFLADWGVAVDDGIVYQSDFSKIMSMNNYWSVADYTEELYAKPAINRRLLTVVPEARPLRTLFDDRGDISVSVPLLFTQTAFVVPIELVQGFLAEDVIRFGPIPAFVVATMAKTVYVENRWVDVRSQVLVFGSHHIIGSSSLNSASLGNLEYILNVFAVITDNPDTVFIAPKIINMQELPITGNTIVVLGILFIGLLPSSILVAGGIVFIRRRRL